MLPLGVMPSRNEPCPCGSGQKYKRCCLGDSRRSGGNLLSFLPPRRGRPTGVDEVTAEAAVLAEDVLHSPDVLRALSDGMVLLREMFREEGPLASLRWSWDEFAPVVERHIYQVTAEVEDMDERRARLFTRCAPELLSPERLERFEQVLRRTMMEPERTLGERRALAMAVLGMGGVPRHPPYTSVRLHIVAWLMMAQVTEWARSRIERDIVEALELGEEPADPRVESWNKWVH